MSQLIKLQDFISRYEQDIYHYSSQYVSVKHQEWSQLKRAFDAGDLSPYLIKEEMDLPVIAELPEEGSFRKKVIRLFRKDRGAGKEAEDVSLSETEDEKTERKKRFLRTVPADEQELKQAFLNYFYSFQLKWAMSARDDSFTHLGRYQFDELLRFVLQRFPDNCLVLYRPVLEVKNVSVELDVILLTPTDTWCLVFLEAEDDSVFTRGEGRFWTRTHHNKAAKKVLDPLITLNRMQWIIEQIFTAKGISFPVRKAVICRNGYINNPNADLEGIIDKRKFTKWFDSIRHNHSTIKHLQLKAANALLMHGSGMNRERMNKEEELSGNHGESGSW